MLYFCPHFGFLQYKKPFFMLLLLTISIIQHVYSTDTLDCNFVGRDFILPGINECPVFRLYNTSSAIIIPPNYSYSDLTGIIGYCGTPPIAVNNSPTTASTLYTTVHHITLIFPIPWCFTSFSFIGNCGIVGGRYEGYPDYFGPSVVFNERPIQQECLNHYGQSSNVTYEPFPLWDRYISDGGPGQQSLGTIRIAINDSCSFSNTIPKSLMQFYFVLINGTYTFVNASGGTLENTSSLFYNNISSTGSASNHIYASYAETDSVVPSSTGKWCTDACDTLPQAICYEQRTQQNKEIFRGRSVVSLSCKDTGGGFGMVWRVDNIYSYNTHFDWYLKDILQNVNIEAHTGIDPNINLTVMNISRNKGYNDSLYNGFWSGVCGKRRVSSNSYFYIPTYIPSSLATQSFSLGGALSGDASSMIMRPSYLDLYAGYPSHYNGSTILAGIVDFFDMRTWLNMNSFIEFNQSIVGIVSPGNNATYRDKNVTQTIRFDASVMDLYVPKDYERQVIINVCLKALNTTETINEMVTITGVNGWINLCSFIQNESKIWSETLDMLYYSFPGILSSPTEDPIPVCNCSNVGVSPCGSSTEGDPDMMKQYTPPSISLSVNSSIKLVCKMNNDTLNKIYKTVNNNSTFVTNIYDPNLSSGDFGYVWSIENKNMNDIGSNGLDISYLTTSNDLYVRWAIGNYIIPFGNVGISDPPLPYPYPDGTVSYIDPSTNLTSFYATHDTTIRAGTIYYFFSMTSQPHKMYGTFQQLCGGLNNQISCSDYFPKDPPTLSSPYGWSYAADNIALDLIDSCECGVNIPCELGSFLFNIDSSLNLSTLLIEEVPPGPPISYPVQYDQCVPKTEVCNGYDDDCNDIVDDIPGVGQPCGVLSLDNIGQCRNGVLTCPNVTDMVFNYPILSNQSREYYENLKAYKPICLGQVLPSEEICNLVDDNCDGIIDNIPPDICGSYDLGVCRKGYQQCDLTPEVICYGKIDPVPEICEDGLDNDCDGIIDNGCVLLLSFTDETYAQQVNELNNIEKTISQQEAYLLEIIQKNNVLFNKNDITSNTDQLSASVLLDKNPNSVNLYGSGISNVISIYGDTFGEIYDYLITLSNSLAIALLLVLVFSLLTCVVCSFGVLGGCWFCYRPAIFPWDTYNIMDSQNNIVEEYNGEEQQEKGNE